MDNIIDDLARYEFGKPRVKKFRGGHHPNAEIYSHGYREEMEQANEQKRIAQAASHAENIKHYLEEK